MTMKYLEPNELEKLENKKNEILNNLPKLQIENEYTYGHNEGIPEGEFYLYFDIEERSLGQESYLENMIRKSFSKFEEYIKDVYCQNPVDGVIRCEISFNIKKLIGETND